MIRQATKRRDAREPLHFEITKADIACAEKCDAEHCVIAEAVCRIPGVSHAQVSNSIAEVRFRDGKWLRFQIANRLQLAIKSFDAGEDFEEYAPAGLYELSVPTKARTMKAERERATARRGTPAKDRRYGKTGAHKPRVLSARNQFARAQAERTK